MLSLSTELLNNVKLSFRKDVGSVFDQLLSCWPNNYRAAVTTARVKIKINGVARPTIASVSNMHGPKRRWFKHLYFIKSFVNIMYVYILSEVDSYSRGAQFHRQWQTILHFWSYQASFVFRSITGEISAYKFVKHCSLHMTYSYLFIECSPGKYYWKEEDPGQFYACVELTRGINPSIPDYVTNAIRMKCAEGTYMCSLQTDVSSQPDSEFLWIKHTVYIRL